MPSSKKNGYFYGFKREDLVKFKDGTVGVITGRLCHAVSHVECWTLIGEHSQVRRSLRKAEKLSIEDFISNMHYTGGPFITDTAQFVLGPYEED